MQIQSLQGIQHLVECFFVFQKIGGGEPALNKNRKKANEYKLTVTQKKFADE
ncbi:hypothetical protein [Lactobacillus intestinalis]|uniref:Uncharacterized protein n=1 Tax=Lactobacillus intestinalis DSM 6629 TaxID=1423761 RepID=A0ABR5PTM0_9LACO|nr:hypothetical protein [Lactobacillus intestinalis]KRM34730.1 hypothetical protein FC44_GL000774 [Lactobacillus intestinalis DSM 6629]UTW41159.1 hypothetical protein KBW87_08535 [Lactobacillus intestinalis]